MSVFSPPYTPVLICFMINLFVTVLSVLYIPGTFPFSTHHIASLLCERKY